MTAVEPFRYRPFGAYRFVLAVLVAVSHLHLLAGAGAFLSPLGLGNMAVMSFFILSGYVITEAIAMFYGDRPGAFLVNRLLRIFPPFLVALALAIVVHVALARYGTLEFFDDVPDPDAMFSTTNIIGNTFSLVLPVGLGRLGFDVTYPFVRYAWAVAIELLFYYGMALLALLAVRYAQPSKRAAFRWAAATLLGIAAFLIYSLSGNGYPLQWTPYFVLGVSLYRHATTDGTQRTWALVVVIASLVFVNWHAYEYMGRNPRAEVGWALLILDVLIAVLYLLSRVSMERRWIRADQFLGDLTYPLYLNHYLVGIVFLTLAPRDWRSPLLFVASLFVATLFAYGAMQLSEPFTRRLRASIRGRALS